MRLRDMFRRFISIEILLMNHLIASARRAFNTFLCLTLSILLFGCGGGGSSPSPSPLPSSSSSSQAQQVPEAPTVAVSYGVKQVILNWTAVNGATYYKVLRNPTGTAGFTQIGSNLTASTASFADTVAVHLTDWINISYKVSACNTAGCADSTAINSFNVNKAIGYFKASNTDASDLFGWALALSADGNTLAVGAIQESSNATGINGNQSDNSKLNSGAVYIFIHTGNSWSQQAYVKASNADANDLFGSALALSADGNTLAVSAVGESSNAKGINGGLVAESDNSKTDSGTVYVFTRNGSSWSQQAYVKASNTDANDQFGFAVALSTDGNTLAVSAVEESSDAKGINGGLVAESDNSKTDSGAVYVFTRNGSSWSQQAYIKASNTDANDLFGWALALSADSNTLAVSATRESSNAKGINGGSVAESDNSKTNSGAVYLFTRSGSSWSQQAYIKASNTDANDLFGSALALSLDGNTLAVGAAAEDSNVTGINGDQSNNAQLDSGAVYVFTRSDSTWSQQAYVKASNTDAGDQFGNVVALSSDGNTLAVGAVAEDSNATGVNGIQLDNTKREAGAAYVFTRRGSSWLQQSYIKASTTDVFNQLGSAVALSADGNTLAVGAFGESSNSTGINGIQADTSKSQSGAVYMY